ncbi:MAG: nucleoside triphosphate pyrophosphohydrolase, partial [Pseudomonadota bacterium]
QDLFDFNVVADAIAEKMIARHPHVFGEEAAQNASDVNEIWDRQKDKEQGEQTSALDGVTIGLPALLRAQKLQKRAARVGFEWSDTDGAISKLE